MDYLQYISEKGEGRFYEFRVLNLIINGLPSIPKVHTEDTFLQQPCFKPYYKWITFNTLER